MKGFLHMFFFEDTVKKGSIEINNLHEFPDFINFYKN